MDSTLGGSIGLFVNNVKKHYLITAARNLLPELSRMNQEDMVRFDELVPFAHYDIYYDRNLEKCDMIML